MKPARLLSLAAACALGLCGCASGTVSNPGYCGDGVVQPELGEQCDDGNPFGGDGCSAHCISEAGAEIDCQNGVDDDNDGLIDCADPGCQLSPECSGVTETQCDNGIDDDNDGFTDCADPDCAGRPCGPNGRVCVGGACQCGTGQTEEVLCTDGVDDDCDGLTDCADPDCSGSPACVGTETSCTDGIDNDGDGMVDCADADCANLPCGANGRQCQGGSCVCPGGTTEVCGDGIDNNCNGQIDEGCGGTTCTNPLAPAAECGSGAHCMPTTTLGAPGQCESPAGSGVQYDYCLANDECAPGYLCVDVGDILPNCLQFCTSWTQCPYSSLEDCYPLNTPIYVNTQEWGVCYWY